MYVAFFASHAFCLVTLHADYIQEIASLEAEVALYREKQACCEASLSKVTEGVQAEEVAHRKIHMDLRSQERKLREADRNVLQLKASVTRACRGNTVRLLSPLSNQIRRCQSCMLTPEQLIACSHADL